jgi:DNA-directed RNA polymerase sigma subunit (sigma70/sigma32)
MLQTKTYEPCNTKAMRETRGLIFQNQYPRWYEVRLKENQAEVIARYFGLNRRPETLNAIASDMGLTRQRVDNIKRQALKHIDDYHQYYQIEPSPLKEVI